MKSPTNMPTHPASDHNLTTAGNRFEPRYEPRPPKSGLDVANGSDLFAPARARSVDGHSFAIGILAVTACILFVGLILVLNNPAPAFAAGMNDRGGDYIMVTQQLSESVEGVLVVDAASKVGILYGYDYNQKKIERLAPNLRIDRLPTPNDPKGEKAGAKKKPGG